MITLDMVKSGYEAGIIKLVDGSTVLGDGIVCSIGDNWFYFGGQTAEEYTDVEKYKNDVPKSDILKSIFEVLEQFSTEFEDEYLYYESFLREGGILLQEEVNDTSVSLRGRLGVQFDNITRAELEVLKKNDPAARDLLVDLIKSDRCFLCGESYFPPEPNEEYLSEELGFDIDYQPIHDSNNLNQAQTNVFEASEIIALRGNISNLRKELDSVLLYDPDYAPALEKILAVQELQLDAALEGVTINLESDSIIDASHLNCFWYGGPIGTLEYKGYTVSIEVHGDVSVTVLDNDMETELLDYRNKNNSGAYGNSEVLDVIKADEELQLLCNDGRLVYSNNNWIEYLIWDNNELVGPTVLDNVLDTDNVLEAFSDVSLFKNIIDDLERQKTVDNKKNAKASSLFIFDDELIVNDDNRSVNGYLWAMDSLVDRLSDADEKFNINFYADYDVLSGNITVCSTYFTDEHCEQDQKIVPVPFEVSEKAELVNIMEAYCKSTYSMTCLELVNDIRTSKGLGVIGRNEPEALDDKISAAGRAQLHKQEKTGIEAPTEHIR